jgi:CxxC-x17-CxxC domain-containing protein
MEEETVEDEEETETEEAETSEEEVKEDAEKPKVSEEKEVDSFTREMHKAVCADCGKDCEVPFKPTEGRPVYCRDCYRKHVPQRRRY